MNLLAEVPGNYLGEMEGTDPYILEKGSWYFDKPAKTLVYIVDNTGYFSGGWTIRHAQGSRSDLCILTPTAMGSLDNGVDPIEGLRLAALEPYKWVK